MIKIELNQKEYHIKVDVSDVKHEGVMGKGIKLENMVWSGVNAVIYGGVNAMVETKRNLKQDENIIEISIPKSDKLSKNKNQYVMDVMNIQLRTLHSLYPEQIILIDKELV